MVILAVYFLMASHPGFVFRKKQSEMPSHDSIEPEKLG